MNAAERNRSRALELDFAPTAPAVVLLRGARLLDPRTGLDGVKDVLVRDGRVAELGSDLEAPDGAELVDAEGLHAFPAFVDPHVHLRTPGREDEEDIDSGTRAAAAGGFCAILAQPNTHPVVDSAPVLRSLRERARAEARIPTGFLAAITVGQQGEKLTEMADLAGAGALGFTDDGLPVRSAGVMRQALQYQRLAGRLLALHEEDPTLSGEGVMHEGEVSALMGLAGIPSVSESAQVARDCALAAYEEGRIHVQHVSARETVEVLERAKAAGTQVTCEASPHHLLLTHEAVRSLDTNFKMNPPLRAEEDRAVLVEALRAGTIDCVATDHAPHAREEKESPFEQAPMGVTGLETAFAALHTELVLPGVLDLGLLVERMTAGGEPFGLPLPRIERGAPANICLVDLDAEWEVGEAGYESRSANCAFAGRRLTGRVRMTIAAGVVAYRERTFALGGRGVSAAYLLLEDGTRFDGDAAGATGVDGLGEVVFNTSMSGYQEAVSDPSYAGQIIVFTYPLIGNYGVSEAHMESDRIHARAVIMREGVDREDAAHAEGGWLTWLADCGVPALSGVDTRALVRHIRAKGAMRGGVFAAELSEAQARERLESEPPMSGRDLAREVTPAEPQVLPGPGPRVVGIDTGIKSSIVRNLRERGVHLELLPCTASAADVLARDPDAVFLANGPGDPAALGYVVENVRELVGKVPVWGICLGHQLLCRAVGLETFKMPFGHRGANHPVKDLETGKIEITSQNHGFAVLGPGGERTIESDEPVRWETDFGTAELQQLNLYDRTVEGLVLRDVPGSTVQYHPEAGPGPHDAEHLFDRFIERLATPA